MCWRYSVTVVAPITCISPLAKAGFRTLAASMPPSAAPAPTRVWISSMKSTIRPALFGSSLSFTTSFTTAFSLSSKSPRYLVPATREAKSKLRTRQSSSRLGASPLTMRCAIPSAMAVLPTPGSPIKQGLDLRRRTKTCNALATSSVRPATGSSLPSLASAVKSVQHSLRAGNFLSLRPPPPPATNSAFPVPLSTSVTSSVRSEDPSTPTARRVSATPESATARSPLSALLLTS
mmetsp:Transcript_51949/g.103111  ORF Transcript_51949/g.103111 Transcript_51949/m.103111 type:complete len:234 (-) Transcript_51949:699-1400(-)